jgi:hypothetical protein
MWAMSLNGDGMSDAIKAEVRSANLEGREVQLTEEQMAELGHGKKPLLKVIRAFCVQCMGGSEKAVRLCTSPGCSHFPYRMGRNPYTGIKGHAGSLRRSPTGSRISEQAGEGTIQTGLDSSEGKEG